ncbi:MAG: TolC family protein [Candidatus Aminicenantes bacterium]|nr:MAG: TolC family protein [Candidatus Aminicenantes bacterium]
MRSKWCVLLIFACIICSAPNFIEAEEALTLDQCISLALKNNNLLKAVQQELRASRARTKQAWAFPQPEFSFDSDLQPKFFNFKQSGESYVGISQLIEFPGRRYLRGKIAGKESEMVNCEVYLGRQEIIYNVKQSFYQLLLTRETQKFAEENLEMAQDFFAKAKEKYESGEVAKFEMLRAKVEAAKAEHQIKVAVNQVNLAKAQLNFFLARDRFQSLDIQGTLRGAVIKLELKELQGKALSFRPEIKKERLAVKKESLAKKQAFLSYLPDVSLGISRHRIELEPTSWDVTLSFEVPLFFWQKINGEIAEANANLAAANERLKYLELSVCLEVENAYYNVISLQNQIQLFEKEVLDEAEQVYHMSMISYQEGKIGSIELIESRRSLAEIKQVYAETLFNYQLALAELEKSLGTSIKKD